MGFKQSEVDPCLFYKDVIYIGTYIDDNFVMKKENEIKKFIKELNGKGLKVTIKEGLCDYLSCSIVMNKEMTKAWIGQPHLIKKLKKEFDNEIAGLKRYDTPGSPSKRILKNVKEEDILNPTMQTRLRSGIGMLMFLTKHSQPDLSNPVRELSKCMGKGDDETMKELRQVIKFVIDKKDYGLKI